MTQPTDSPIKWEQDGVDSLWWISCLGSVRGAFGAQGYRDAKSDGWWFLPADKPDHRDYDVGPFRSKRAAMRAAEAANVGHE